MIGLAGSGVYLHHVGYTAGQLDAERVAFVAAQKQSSDQAAIVEKMNKAQKRQAHSDAEKLAILRKANGPCLDRRIPAGVYRQLR